MKYRCKVNIIDRNYFTAETLKEIECFLMEVLPFSLNETA